MDVAKRGLRRAQFGAFSRRGIAVGGCLVLLAISTAWRSASAEPVVTRVSFASRSDDRGYVIRVHASEAIPDEDYEVDLLGRNTVLVVLHETRLSSSFKQDRAVGPIADYFARQRRKRVEIRFRLHEATPVHVVFYPDRDSNDFLVSLSYSSAYSSIAAKTDLLQRRDGSSGEGSGPVRRRVVFDPPPTKSGSGATREAPRVAEASQAERVVQAEPKSEPETPADPTSSRLQSETPPSTPPQGGASHEAERRPRDTGGEQVARSEQGNGTRASSPVPETARQRRTESKEKTTQATLPAAKRLDAPPLPARAVASTSTPTGDPWKLDCIVIDAGHGGKDPGTQAYGLREKDVTLAIALKLGRYIEERLGVRVVYTRTDDRFIELAQRGKMANEAGGKLFVSIHVNAVGGSRAKSVLGTSTYFLGLHKTDSAREVMERENAVVKLESDPGHYAAFSEDEMIMQTLAQSAYLEKSEQLAALVESEFQNRAGRHSRGVKQAGFYVLWSASMPAVLVETGFATHPEEARFLNTERGQDLIASAVFRAIRDFRADYERDLGIVSEAGE